MSATALPVPDTAAGFVSKPLAQSSTGDLDQTFSVMDDCYLEGTFFQKPATTVLQIILQNAGNGVTMDLVLSEAASAETSGFRNAKIPILKGSTIRTLTTGGVDGVKKVDFVFRPAK